MTSAMSVTCARAIARRFAREPPIDARVAVAFAIDRTVRTTTPGDGGERANGRVNANTYDLYFVLSMSIEAEVRVANVRSRMGDRSRVGRWWRRDRVVADG